MGVLQHVVQFKYTEETTKEKEKEIYDEFLGLKQKCMANENQYILSLTGGKNNSPEGMSNGFTYCFIVQFKSEADRDYYAFKDPAHLNFVSKFKPHLAGAQVLDFWSE